MVEGEWIEKIKKTQNILHHLRATNIISSYLGSMILAVTEQPHLKKYIETELK